MLAILGSGFGLYGYLPALAAACGQKILLPARYQARFASRLELASFGAAIEWAADVDDALARADGIVFALRPGDQFNYISRCVLSTNITRLLLEKPLAPNPEMGARAMDALRRSGKIYRIGYTFRHTRWAPPLARAASSGEGELNLEWCFMAHHFRHELQNWKRVQTDGGGVIGFYGVQLIALLAELGYREVHTSDARGENNMPERWTARFAGDGLVACNITVDSRMDRGRFRVEHATTKGSAVLAELSDPFDEGAVSSVENADRRIESLTALCRSWLHESERSYGWYDSTIELWRRVEDATHWRYSNS